MILRTQGGMLAAAAVLTSTGGPALTACAPVVVASGVGAGVMVATDRRTTGAQVDASTSGVTRVVKVFEYTN